MSLVLGLMEYVVLELNRGNYREFENLYRLHRELDTYIKAECDEVKTDKELRGELKRLEDLLQYMRVEITTLKTRLDYVSSPSVGKYIDNVPKHHQYGVCSSDKFPTDIGDVMPTLNTFSVCKGYDTELAVKDSLNRLMETTNSSLKEPTSWESVSVIRGKSNATTDVTNTNKPINETLKDETSKAEALKEETVEEKKSNKKKAEKTPIAKRGRKKKEDLYIPPEYAEEELPL